MELRSQRRYDFPTDARTVWDTIAAVHRYRTWWPWLRRFDGRGLVAGDEWRCTVQPPLPYLMRFTIHLDEVTEPRLIRATVRGDISGTAVVEIEERTEGSTVHLTSTLAPDTGFLQAITFLARPVVRYGHDWVLDTGARQFATRAL